MTRRRCGHGNNLSFSKKIKDYIVPIIGGILVLFLIYSFFSKGDNKDKITSQENQTGISINMDTGSTATIFYTGGSKKDAEPGMSLYKGEKITVSSGRIEVSDSNISFNLNKLGELKYLENGDYYFSSGEAWVNNVSSANIEMKFAKLKVEPNSHISLSQNEMNSTVYVVSGTVEISNLKGRSTVLSSMEKLEISRAEASDEKIDLKVKKEPIDNYFLKSDWFTINKGNEFLGNGTSDESQTGTNSTGETNGISNTGTAIQPSFSGKSSLLTFSNLLDESNVSSGTIIISGVYDTEIVAKIEVNGNIAILNPEVGTFRIENVDVSNKENDLVFKVFDANEDQREKFVYTVYYDGGQNNNSSNGGTNFKVNTFDVDGRNFKFTSPTTGDTYTTYDDFITIRGSVSAQGIDRVTVNDYKLNSFNGSTWRYHARNDYGNLANGTNVYEVKYYSGNKLVYKNYFTIIKKEYGSSGNTNPAQSNNTESGTGAGE